MPSYLATYAALGVAIVCEIAGTTFLQESEQFTRIAPALATTACYAAAFYFLSLVLKAMPLGVAYAIWSGVGVVLTAVIGTILFKQSLDLPALVGIGMIVGGVVVMQAFSVTTGH
ncbi:Multidrug transporter EmrE [Methylorubrum aminovorans]|uniref:Multidrug transporter EmrE n=1 Tax=Methylorubrum aminovorans TaxID=269069 RepID=A0ABQ4UL09_9HYPH|nr:SMR family transporter [Methylorubrum aminovorans]GJE67847.1 Multidrug transporter EmrE [Methylorubrum aminovorans]GMA74886.1 multidrug transporter [Methylorubrum aminovorans]